MQSYYEAPERCYDDFGLPVPVDISFGQYSSGDTLQGIVVKVAELKVPQVRRKVYELVLFAGRVLYIIRATRRLKVGEIVAGTAHKENYIGTCLTNINDFEPEGLFKLNTNSKQRSKAIRRQKGTTKSAGIDRQGFGNE